MKITKEIYQRILNCPSVPPETGGILGEKNGIICAYCYDIGNVVMQSAQYIPDTEKLNRQIGLWEEAGTHFCGIAHSHPPGQISLSSSDMQYIELIFAEFPDFIRSLYFPVVQAGQSIVSYIASRSGSGVVIREDPITIV